MAQPPTEGDWIISLCEHVAETDPACQLCQIDNLLARIEKLEERMKRMKRNG